jgi:cytochrome c oxidase accessory protein FixG
MKSDIERAPSADTQSAGIIRPEEAASILPTLNDDGSRRWLRPRPSPGRYLTRRRAVAWILIAIFTALPHLRISDKPAILLDLAARRFTFFGKTLLPSDTLVMALLMVAVFLTIFFVTALFGRVWCGWACPQTVYLEFVFRPIERFFRGTPGRINKGRFVGSPVAILLQYLSYFLIACILAHTFLAYFVGVDALAQWVRRSPFEHPTSFLIMAGVTSAMLFDFAFFREQTCLVACPYGRFQSVLLDRSSLIVGYDIRRGEPRRKPAKESISLPLAVQRQKPGDCVDCGLCVATCPTGIDIRRGLQMECVHCTQCIDACDAVMTKLKRPTGLIRYGTQTDLAGIEPPRSNFRPRLLIYPALVAILLGTAGVVLATQGEATVSVMRSRGATFIERPDGTVSNQARIKLISRVDQEHTYTVHARPHHAAGASDLTVISEENPYTLKPGDSHTINALIGAPASAFINGQLEIDVIVHDESGRTVAQRRYTLLGPARSTHHDTDHHDKKHQEDPHQDPHQEKEKP